MNRLGDIDAQRGSSHRFNNIGNLTYISRILNNYLTGLSDDFIDLEYDSDKVLSAHFLWSDLQKRSIQKAYESVKKAFEKNSKSSADQASKLYDAFCQKRRDLIAMGFEQWLEELRRASLEQMGANELRGLEASGLVESRLEADVPRFVGITELKPRQRIRLFGYEDLVEDQLVKLAKDLHKKRFIVADRFMEMKLAEKKHVWLRLDENGVTINFDHRVADELKRDILSKLNMDLGENLVYRKGTVDTQRVTNLAKAMDRTQELETEIDKGRSLDVKKGSRFEDIWRECHGPRVLEGLNQFTTSMRALKDPEIDVAYRKTGKPFFSLKIKGKIVNVLRPRTYEPSLCDELHKTAIQDTNQLEAVKKFRKRLCDTGIGVAFGKLDRIEILMPINPQRLKQLEGYLKDLSRDLAEADTESRNPE